MRKIYTILLLLVCVNSIFAQEIKTDLPTILPPSPTVAALMKFEEVPVNNYTGVPDISIPLFSSGTHAKNVNLNIALSYHPSSVNANERASDVGLGWSLMAGGTISRTVRGIADEYYKLGSSTNKVGIYHTTESSNHNSYYEFMDILDNGPANSGEEYILQEYQWEAHVKGKYDTEHDLWQYNFMGRSGRFIIKKNATTSLLEVVGLDDSNLKVVNHYDTTSTVSKYTPTSFDIFDDLGNKYVFDIVEITNQNTTTITIGNHINPEECPAVDLLFNNAIFSPTTTYKSAFHLSKVYDNNNKLLIDFHYNDDETTYKEIVIDETTKLSRMTNNNDAQVAQSIAESACIDGCDDGFQAVTKIEPKTLLIKSMRNTKVKKLTEIDVIDKAKIYFAFIKGRGDYNFHHPDSAYVFKKMVVTNWQNDSIKKFTLSHSNSTVIDKERLLLSEVVQSNFENEKTETRTLSYKPSNDDGRIVGKDYWGYYNLIPSGYMGGFYREVNPEFCSTDVLQKMTLPTGGCVVLGFESNSYSYEGDNALTNFDINPHNWIHTTDPLTLSASNDEVVIADGSATEDQMVTFYPEANAYEGMGGIYLRKDTTTVGELRCPAIIPNCGFDFVLEAGHVYKLQYSWSVLSTPPSMNIDVVYHTKKTEIEEYVYGGGIRVKAIGYFTDGNTPADFYDNPTTYPNSIPSKEKNFNYSFFGGSTSSGSLAFPRPVFNYSSTINAGILCTGILIPEATLYDYDVITDFNNLSPINTKGSDIGYKEVTVYEKDNGKTQYTYNSPIDFPEPDLSWAVVPPFLPTENLDYKRGLITKEEVFDDNGKTLTKTESFYDYIDHLELIGVRFYDHPLNCPYASKYTDYDAYKFCVENQSSCFHAVQGIGNCGSDAADFIGNKKINERVGWAQLKTKNNKNYFYPNGGNTANIVETIETYDYNPLNKKISESTVTNSKGEVLTTKYFYNTTDTITRNRISEIERIETSRGTNLLSTSKINYVNTFAGNASYLPQTIQTAKGAQSLENRVAYNKYDEFSNPLELQQEGGTKVCYIWGYNKSQPVAKIENIAYSAIPSTLITNIQSASDTPNNEASILSALTALRNDTALANAMVTTYTYIPLVGVSTITDPKGDKTTYKYDEFGRLKEVRDKDNNILSENEYHYKTQN